jgi:hypothetical protein
MISAAGNRMANQLPLKKEVEENLAHLLHQYSYA